MVTDEQVKLLRCKLMDGKSQEGSAASAGMSARTARRWREGGLPSQRAAPRSWRTRHDPFAGIWDAEVVPLLEADGEGVLEAARLLEELQERHPGRFSPGQLRTLQRRIRDWKALRGPARPVIFPQVHPPGREAVVDFTHASDLGVTLAGKPLAHLLFVFKLSFSGWTWARIAFGETFEALIEGAQGALWALGGVPEVLRHDNLSAATHELKRSGGRALTERFRGVLEHYGLRSTRIRPGESHENGVAERANDLVKRELAQALVLRGSRDFDDLDQYQVFIREAIQRHFNRFLAEKFDKERAHLRPLPSSAVPIYTTYHPTVRRWSTIRVGSRAYSVPSRLIGRAVEVRQYPDFLEVYYRDQKIETMPRLRGDSEARIDYRHIIWSLVRKPGAFARYRFREELFPTITFRQAYDRLRDSRGDRAEVEYVRILHLAASTMESQVEGALVQLLETDAAFDYAAVKALVCPKPILVPALTLPAPDLQAYDRLLVGVR
jgi:transposase